MGPPLPASRDIQEHGGGGDSVHTAGEPLHARPGRYLIGPPDESASEVPQQRIRSVSRVAGRQGQATFRHHAISATRWY